MIVTEKCVVTGVQKRRPAAGGACPVCGTRDVPVTGKGFVGAHVVRPDLGEGVRVPETDSGNFVGTPRDAAIRREEDAAADRNREGVKPRGKTRIGESAAPDPVATSQHGRGPALVRGRDTEPVQPRWYNPKTRQYEVSSIGTMGGNLGRLHVDGMILPERPKARRTPSQRSNYRAKMRRQARAQERKSQ